MIVMVKLDRQRVNETFGLGYHEYLQQTSVTWGDKWTEASDIPAATTTPDF